ncbi:hypothetical protein PCASD_03796 [Puccinia coronata f. sp. avenae]|uniref:DUF6589 domain-containing protein n=1 Tax=Puccinia coronata f. sp. avenae TaxID=200324 RepID=A0A2N5V8E5_9BASI|nr:hypothetical protein PCASD_03796 [Puccinia coronata f. sp. avenae]
MNSTENTSAKDLKVLEICKLLRTPPIKLTPKQFISHFLTSNHSEVAYLRRYWRQETGIESSVNLLYVLRNEITKTATGTSAWHSVIQEEAIKILSNQQMPKGNYPVGSYQSSMTVTKEFFSLEARVAQDAHLKEHMPFLHAILIGMIPSDADLTTNDGVDDLALDLLDPATSSDVDAANINVLGYEQPSDLRIQATLRFRRIVSTVCAMMSYAANRRCNAFQLTNSVRLLACGISERGHEYLNHVGLCSSRWTALAAMKSLSLDAQAKLKKSMSISPQCPIAPSICIDNIDMEEKVRNISVGHRAFTFRGTWGYVHSPDAELIASLDQSELTLESYHNAIQQVKSMTIEPRMFLPSREEDQTIRAVWLSQIAKVLHQYFADPKDLKNAISPTPPVVEQISPRKPNIHMLRLMDASDNSAEGVGQVFHHLLLQSGLSVDEFFGRLQPMDGDLGTVQNFNSLRSQRAPSAYPEDQLDNILFQLGASHTLWNVASTLFTHHFGNPLDSTDCGAWQYLQALGFPPEKAIQKKDFTLMVNQMEKVFESTIYYCLWVIMKSQNHKICDERMVLTTDQWNSIVIQCFNDYCSAQARKLASSSPKLHNTLVQLHDFSTVVEAKRAMKDGDIGRLMIVWKKCSLSKYLRHNLLFSPTGRKGHFVAKDFWLEIQNYWLKYFYNKSGIGTQIKRLQDIFSPNIIMLQSMFHSLKVDCGSRIIHQNHYNNLTERSLEMLTMMANNRDILDLWSRQSSEVIEPRLNTYLAGITRLQKLIRGKDPTLSRFKRHLGTTTSNNRENEELDGDDGEVVVSEDEENI